MKKLVCIATAVVAVFVCQSFATPSTQIWIPSTDIQAFLNPHIGMDEYFSAYNSNPVTSANGLVTNGGITIGLLPPAAKLGFEAGIDFRDIDGNHMDQVYFNGKLALPEDAFFKYMPAVAFGGYDFGVKDRLNDYDVTYGLIARTLPVVGRLSVGGYSGLGPDVLWTSSKGKVEKSGVLASWDRAMTEISSKLWMAVDYQSGDNGYGALSFGASWNWAPNVSTIFGYDIFNDSDLMKPTFTFQLDINAF